MPHTCAVEQCGVDEDRTAVIHKVESMLDSLPTAAAQLRAARKVFVKVNIGIPFDTSYRGHPVTTVDAAVFAGVAAFVSANTTGRVLVGDGCDGISPVDAARQRGHMEIIEQHGFEFVSLHDAPYERFVVREPEMFRWYDLSAVLKDVDVFISVAKMKSHHLCGVTLTLKNLFGLPPGPVYGTPRYLTLHSPVRLPRVLCDLASLFSPAICVVDGIVGGNYFEWGSDPVTSEFLVAGDNAVATDAVAARIMGVDPEARMGTLPFLRAENHIQLAADLGLGSNRLGDIDLSGTIPSQPRPYTIQGATDHTLTESARRDIEISKSQARYYFLNRDRLLDRYNDRAIVLDQDKVIYSEQLSAFSPKDLIAALGGNPFAAYRTYATVVREELSELKAPYEAVTA